MQCITHHINGYEITYKGFPIPVCKYCEKWIPYIELEPRLDLTAEEYVSAVAKIEKLELYQKVHGHITDTLRGLL